MSLRLRTIGGRLATAWFHWTSFKLDVFVGSLVTMPIMAVVITACFTAPDAVELLARRMLP